ncbi:MAG: FAD-dependent monooxygenase [Nostocales cyanobacterium]|nr:MAG: FAD-dependent monooxygenase [Nostocales cyanobacterium]TAF18292.1 MAG: FAD-dependent monooxygenase [Nostocales cyanobacterium]
MVKKVAIIGAGPGGLTLAHYLLRREHKYQIDIYEHRSDPRNIPLNQTRTFPMSLGDRGLKTLWQIPGLEAEVKAISLETTGSILHQKNGKQRRLDRKKVFVSIDRNHLTLAILKNLVKQYDQSRLNIYFDCQCQNINIANKTIKITQNLSEQPTEFTRNYDLLIGADGARSVVREAFSQTQDFQVQTNYVPSAYKSLYLPNPAEILDIKLEPGKVHAWRLNSGISVLLVHQIDKTMNGVILFPYQNNPIAELKTAAQVQQFFQENFPEVSKILPQSAAEEFAQRPISRVLTVRCNRYHIEDSVLLIGDAAHAVSPSIGQGCNSTLEDVRIFNEILDKNADDLKKSLPEYSSLRVADGHAVKDLSDYSFPTDKKLFAEFIIRNSVAKFLHPLFPKKFPPSILDAVFDDDISYSKILLQNQDWISKVKNKNHSL